MEENCTGEKLNKNGKSSKQINTKKWPQVSLDKNAPHHRPEGRQQGIVTTRVQEHWQHTPF